MPTIAARRARKWLGVCTTNGRPSLPVPTTVPGHLSDPTQSHEQSQGSNAFTRLTSMRAPRPVRSRTSSCASTPCAVIAPAARSPIVIGTGPAGRPWTCGSPNDPENACTTPSMAGASAMGPSAP